MNTDKEKKEVVKQAKRLLKKELPKTKEVLDEIEIALILAFNNLSRETKSKATLYGDSAGLQNNFAYCREKVKAALAKLEKSYKVPENSGDLIDITVVDTESIAGSLTFSDESDSETLEDEQLKLKDQKGKKIKMSNLEAAKCIIKLVDDFDGSYNRISNYLEQLQVVKTVIDASQEALALSIVKTKIKKESLKQKVAVAKTIDSLCEMIKKEIVVPNPAYFVSQLREIKFSSVNNYIEEMKKVSTSLTNSYIYKGIDPQNAETLTAAAIVDAMKMVLPHSDARQAISQHIFQSGAAVYDMLMRQGSSIPHSSINAVYKGKSWKWRDRKFDDKKFKNDKFNKCNKFNKFKKYNKGPKKDFKKQRTQLAIRDTKQGDCSKN